MASIIEDQTPRPAATRSIAAAMVLAAGLGAAVFTALAVAGNSPFGAVAPGPWLVGAIALAGLLMLAGGGLSFSRPGPGGALGFAGAMVYLAGLFMHVTFGGLLPVPLVLGLAGSLVLLVGNDRAASRADPRIVHRQSVLTRVTHWTWAAALVFLVPSGLQIWNAYPVLHIGEESGFEYNNEILRIGAENTAAGPRGFTTVFGHKFDTTGVLGMSGPAARPDYVGFPGWATIPSFRDLATGRVVHFFFAWLLVGALAVWLIASLASRHLWRDVILKPRDLRDLPRDILDHVRFRLHHRKRYGPLQKLAYFAVFAILFPLIILTGLTMSPAMNAAWPWFLDIFGGRQTARTLHFAAMMGIVLFTVVHVVMVVLAGPVNELRSMITGYYRTSVSDAEARAEKPE